MKKIFGIIAIILILVLAFAYYIGAFAPIEINEDTMGSYTIAYQEHIGDYKLIGPVMDEVYQSLTADDIITTEGIWIYYDDPTTTPIQERKSEAGSIIPDSQLPKLKELTKKYQIKKIPEQNSIVVEFPYKNKLSIIVGAIRVYPMMMKHMEEKNYGPSPVMEVYNLTEGKITYIRPIIKTEITNKKLEEEITEEQLNPAPQKTK